MVMHKQGVDGKDSVNTTTCGCAQEEGKIVMRTFSLLLQDSSRILPYAEPLRAQSTQWLQSRLPAGAVCHKDEHGSLQAFS